MKIGIIGSGNVAYHLVKMLKETQAVQLYSRNAENGLQVAENFSISFENDSQNLIENNDLIILAVSDDAIEKIAQEIDFADTIITHTSGIKSMHLLKSTSSNYGSFYPLQTFTKNRAVDYQTVPFLIDANNEQTRNTLTNLAKKISSKVSHVQDEKRSRLHLAAVLVNNFSNHLFALAQDYCTENKLDFDLIRPLILETAQKVMTQNPSEIQTGPAKRNDKKTIEQHLSWIEDENLTELYQLFTKSIQQKNR